MSQWTGPIVQLSNWVQFAQALNDEAQRLGLAGDLAVRNFDLVTFELGPNYEMGAEVNRLEIVKHSGTDRDSGSVFWNADEHDHDHDAQPMGKGPADIIYAYVVTLTGTDYLVRYDGPPEEMDITESLTDANGILVYDASKLTRVSKNELWFVTDPRDALLMVFLIKP